MTAAAAPVATLAALSLSVVTFSALFLTFQKENSLVFGIQKLSS